MSWILCTSGAAIKAAGANANATIIADVTTLNAWSDETEGEIIARTDYDWIANYATVSANHKGMLAATAVADISNKIIAYSTDDYYSTAAAQTLIIKNDDKYQKNIATLKDINVRKKMGATA